MKNYYRTNITPEECLADCAWRGTVWLSHTRTQRDASWNRTGPDGEIMVSYLISNEARLWSQKELLKGLLFANPTQKEKEAAEVFKQEIQSAPFWIQVSDEGLEYKWLPVQDDPSDPNLLRYINPLEIQK